MIDVRRNLSVGQRVQLAPPRDPLIELRGVVPKRLIQLRMPYEHDLQKLRVVCFEVEEQAQLCSSISRSRS